MDFCNTPMKKDSLPFSSILFVCTNKRVEGGRISCANEGRCGEAVRAGLKEEIKTMGLKGKLRVSSSGCMDLCEEGPNVMVFHQDGRQTWYKNVQEENISLIFVDRQRK